MSEVVPNNTLIELEWAWLKIGMDEISIIQKEGIQDSPKVRLVTRVGHGMGAFSFNIGDENRQKEMCLILGRRGEDFDEAHRNSGALLFMLNDGKGDEDENMRKVFWVLHDRIASLVPITGVEQGMNNQTPTHFLRAPGGETEIHIQGDGNFVVYDVRTQPWKVLWASANCVQK